MATVDTNLPVDAGRIADVIKGLARITEPDKPYTRRAFTPLFLDGRAFLESASRRPDWKPGSMRPET
jgi:N-carbamoyl-L-amino-acid hydrolase